MLVSSQEGIYISSLWVKMGQEHVLILSHKHSQAIYIYILILERNYKAL